VPRVSAMSRRARLHGAVACSLAAFAAAPAGAASCNLSPQGVIFGSYDWLSPVPLDAVGYIHVSCDDTVSFTLALAVDGGSVAGRRMTSGRDYLDYELYTNASRTSFWGDGIRGSDLSITGESVDLPIYGRIPANQNVPANSYSDTITVTISY
jgi:spore coat protein U-like protein